MSKPVRLSCHSGFKCKSQFYFEWQLFSSSLCSTPSAGRRWRWLWSRWLPAGRWRKEELSPTLIRWTSTRTFLNCRTIRDELERGPPQKILVFKWTLFKFTGTGRCARCITGVVYKSPICTGLVTPGDLEQFVVIAEVVCDLNPLQICHVRSLSRKNLTLHYRISLNTEVM